MWLISLYWYYEWINSEAVTRRCSVRKVFFKISQNSQENTRRRLDSGAGAFLWIFRNFSEHLFLQDTSGACLCKFTHLRYCHHHVEKHQLNQEAHQLLGFRKVSNLALQKLRDRCRISSELHVFFISNAFLTQSQC